MKWTHYVIFDKLSREVDSIHDHTDDGVRRLIELESNDHHNKHDWDIAYYAPDTGEIGRLCSYLY